MYDLTNGAFYNLKKLGSIFTFLKKQAKKSNVMLGSNSRSVCSLNLKNTMFFSFP